jgi:hypothetical protein
MVTQALGKLSYYQCIVHRGETDGMYVWILPNVVLLGQSRAVGHICNCILLASPGDIK